MSPKKHHKMSQNTPEIDTFGTPGAPRTPFVTAFVPFSRFWGVFWRPFGSKRRYFCVRKMIQNFNEKSSRWGL